MLLTEIAPGVFSVADFLTAAECSQFIRRAATSAFEPAPIASASGPKVDERTRSNDRQVWDDFALAQGLWSRAQSFVVARDAWQPVGLNERFRFYRYRPGQRFAWHADAPFRRSREEISLLTLLIYLNEDYEGGTTRFEATKVYARTGLALFFEHGLVHEGAPVTAGAKYVLRSDVMFRMARHNGA